jgi:hypothetical protein
VTTSIEVSFGANSGDVSQAQIPVEVIDAKMGTAWRGTTTLSGRTTVTVSEPGVYLVRATLPSGALMSSTVRVAKDQTTKATLRPPKQSPNEGLAWAYYMQRLPARSGWREHVSVVDDAAVAGDLAFAPAIQPSCDFWLQGRGNVWRPALPTDLTIQAVSINPGDPTALMATEVSIVNSVASVWAAIEWQNARQLVAVPVWNLQRIRVLIVRNDADDHDVAPFRALVGGSHPQVEAILGFLTSGDFEAARQIGQLWFDQAEQMLRDKVIDPIAATVAGYFLLRAGAFDRMGDWTTNLATWFPSIPDGAVICGWHMALTNRWDLAEHWLTEAVQRGVPLYTQGLRLLYDGLRVLVARSARVGDSFDRVQAIAARAKWTSGVTSLMATDPLELQKQSTAAVAGGR